MAYSGPGKYCQEIDDTDQKEDFMKHDLSIRWLEMMHVFPLFMFTVALLSISSTTFGQSSLESNITAHNSDGFIPPDFSYFSVFGPYQRYQEEAVTSWPEANATVDRIGGWRFYAEEASQPDQTDLQSVTPLQPLTSPLTDDSGKHTDHGGKP